MDELTLHEQAVFKTTAARSRQRGYSLTSSQGRASYVFREGDLGTEMYIIHEGQVEIIKHDPATSEQLLAVLEKGDFFGEMALLEELPRTASARALTDVKLLQINGSTFDQMLRDNPEIAVRMMRKLSRRLRETDDLLKAAARDRRPRPLRARCRRRTCGCRRDGPGAAGPRPLRHGVPTSRTAPRPRSGARTRSPASTRTSTSRRSTASARSAAATPRSTAAAAKFFLAEEIGTMNGTFLNGARLETGVPAEVKPGDEVRFGVVVLRFDPGPG